MKKALVKSYAKINIGLNVVSLRKDGYHELDMVMVPLELHDSILFYPLQGKRDHFITFDDFALYRFKHNLVLDAINVLHKEKPFDEKLRAVIHKVIPVEAGFGGGSSNAASTLTGLNSYLKLGISQERLLELGKTIGADVPFFIVNKPVRCKGIGEQMTPITIKNDYWVLLIKPEMGCGTKEIYGRMIDSDYNNVDIDKIIKALEEGDDDTLASSLGNSLLRPACDYNPEIEPLITLLKANGLKIVTMTGSGSAVFAMSTDKKLIKQVAKKLDKDYWVEVTKILKE